MSSGDIVKISFMSWACPNWTLEQTVENAVKLGYDGIDPRVDRGHKHNISSKMAADERRRALNLIEQNGIEFSSIATQVRIGSPDENERRLNMKQGKAYAILARDLESKVIRIFVANQPGVTTTSEGKTSGLTDEILDRVAEDLCELGEYGYPYCVTPAIEEGHPFKSDALRLLLDRADTENAGVIWNRSEIDRESFLLLRGNIISIHAHNDMLDPENEDIFHTLKLLTSSSPRFTGYVNLEIERIEGVKTIDQDLSMENFQKVITKFRTGCSRFKLPFW